jgi:hypothetical protein
VRLAQEAIHEGGLAVVNVRDDGDVTKVGSFGLHFTSSSKDFGSLPYGF